MRSWALTLRAAGWAIRVAPLDVEAVPRARFVLQVWLIHPEGGGPHGESTGGVLTPVMSRRRPRHPRVATPLGWSSALGNLRLGNPSSRVQLLSVFPLSGQ